MYTQLKELMGYATHFYGPTSKEVAFSVPVQSWSTVVNNQWYVGTTLPLESLAGIYITPPPAEETPSDTEVTEAADVAVSTDASAVEEQAADIADTNA